MCGYSRMEIRGIQCGVPVERNREVCSVGYSSYGTVRSSVWGTGRMEQVGLQCGVPVEQNREVFCVWYKWNGTLRPSFWDNV